MRLQTRLPIAIGALLLVNCGGTVMHVGETDGDLSGGGSAGSSSHAGGPTAGGGSGGTSTTGGTGGTFTTGGTGGTFTTGGTGGTSTTGGAGGSGGSDIPASCDTVKLTQLALTGVQYDRTVRDLLGDVAPVPHRFAAESRESGFRSVPATFLTDSATSELVQAATEVADRALAHLDDLWTCGPADDRTCAAEFLLAFAARAYRRPLTPVERVSVQSALDSQSVPLRSAVRNVIARVLADRRFYIFLSGEPGTSGLLEPYAMASRLSYFLTRSAPDAQLLAAAAAGELATVEQVRAQAYRLIVTPGAAEMARDFFAEWLELDRLDSSKDPVVYPQFASLRDDMVTETLSVGEEVMFGYTGWQALLRYPYTYVNDNLAALYGIPDVVGPSFRRVEVDQKQRVGFLTQASFLSAHASSSESNPVRRGLFVARNLLCEAIPAPPANVPPLTPPLPDGQTTRQRYAAHSANPCAACHTHFDPMGFGFEHFDAIGQYRATEKGMVIDATGKLVNNGRGDLLFDGASELVDQLATLSEVPDCIGTQLFRFALQRVEEDGDRCSLRVVQDRLRARANLRDTLVTIATTDAFRYARW